MKTIKIIETKVTLAALADLAVETYTTMIKGAIDIEKKRVAFGGDYHIESCEELTRSGSSHTDVWGFNLVFGTVGTYELEYDSLINIKPLQGNRSRAVESAEVQEKMKHVIGAYIEL
jgi:Protein of unknown function (DUF5674)